MREILIFISFIFFNYSFLAQISSGAKEISLANSTVAMSDNAMAVFGNPAGSAQLNWKETSLYYSPSRFDMKEFAEKGGAFLLPFRFGVVSGGYLSYGFDLYKETTVSLGFSKVFYKRILFGISLHYRNVKISGYGNAGSLFFNVGGIFFINRQIKIGFLLENPARISYKNTSGQIPSVISFGVSACPTTDITLNTSIVKDMEYPFSYRFGLEYGIYKYIDLRCGFRTNPNSYTGGIGIKYKYIELDYSFFTNSYLPLSHQVGIIIALGDITRRKEMIRKNLNLH
jgi:hypothetical protein